MVDGVRSALSLISHEAAPFLSLLRPTDWQILLCGQVCVNEGGVMTYYSLPTMISYHTTPYMICGVCVCV